MEEKASASAKQRPWWRRAPLYAQIVVALALGVLAGLALPAGASRSNIPAQIH